MQTLFHHLRAKLCIDYQIITKIIININGVRYTQVIDRKIIQFIGHLVNVNGKFCNLPGDTRIAVKLIDTNEKC